MHLVVSQVHVALHRKQGPADNTKAAKNLHGHCSQFMPFVGALAVCASTKGTASSCCAVTPRCRATVWSSPQTLPAVNTDLAVFHSKV